MKLEWMTATEVAGAVASGALSATEIAEATLERARTAGAAFNCYTAVFEERALAEAKRIDVARRSGAPLGVLAGVPVAVKNLFDVSGVVTIAGSIINRDRAPALDDAAALKRLKNEGAVLVGALGMDEYAYGFTSENTHYGPIRNPHDLERTAGGSSGGSSASVAGGCVPIALGSDTNGSVRVPAALCGVFGLKPTFGRVSRAGSALFTPSLDHVGFFCRSVQDASLLFDVTHGYDAEDPVSSERAREETLPYLEDGIQGVRIGRAVGYFEEECTAEALDAVNEVAEALGVATSGYEIPEAKVARAAAMIVSAVEGSAVHLNDLRTRPSDFDPMTRDRFLAGALLSGVSYVRAQMFRQAYQIEVRKVFDSVDVLIAPATPMVAPKIGQETIDINGFTFPSRAHLGRLTQPISFVGLPVVVVPLMTGSGLPIGVQLIGAPYSEALLLRVARFLEVEGVAKVVHPVAVYS